MLIKCETLVTNLSIHLFTKTELHSCIICTVVNIAISPFDITSQATGNLSKISLYLWS